MKDFLIILFVLVWSISQILWLSQSIQSIHRSERLLIIGLIIGPFAFLLPKPKISLDQYISPKLYEHLKGRFEK